MRIYSDLEPLCFWVLLIPKNPRFPYALIAIFGIKIENEIWDFFQILNHCGFGSFWSLKIFDIRKKYKNWTKFENAIWDFLLRF